MDSKKQGMAFFGYRVAIFFLGLTVCAQSFVILYLTGYEFNLPFALSQNTIGIFPLDLGLFELLPESPSQTASAAIVPVSTSFQTELSSDEILDGELAQAPSSTEIRQTSEISKSARSKRAPASTTSKKHSRASIPGKTRKATLSRESMMSALQQAALAAADDSARESQTRRQVRLEQSAHEYTHAVGVVEED